MPLPGCSAVSCHPCVRCHAIPFLHGHPAEDQLQWSWSDPSGPTRWSSFHRNGDRWVFWPAGKMLYNEWLWLVREWNHNYSCRLILTSSLFPQRSWIWDCYHSVKNVNFILPSLGLHFRKDFLPRSCYTVSKKIFFLIKKIKTFGGSSIHLNFLNENYKPSLHKNILICITHIQFFNIYFIWLHWVLVVAHGIVVGVCKIFLVFGM